jgi:hypothetical protein
VEFCDNLIFPSSGAAPHSTSSASACSTPIAPSATQQDHIFGRKISKRYRGKLQTEIEDMDLPNPVIRSHWQRLRQAVCPRSPHAAHRSGKQQCQRLRREQIGGKSPGAGQLPLRQSTTTMAMYNETFWRPLSTAAKLAEPIITTTGETHSRYGLRTRGSRGTKLASNGI